MENSFCLRNPDRAGKNFARAGPGREKPQWAVEAWNVVHDASMFREFLVGNVFSGGLSISLKFGGRGYTCNFRSCGDNTTFLSIQYLLL